MKRISLVAGVLLITGILIWFAAGVGAQDDVPGGEGNYTWAGDVNAPDFPAGADWINVSKPVSMADLRGKIVMLDFWTYGCINCIHIIPDLKRLEAEYPDQLVVIGVHSAKFENEGETENIRWIVQRYEVEHPVVNDRDFVMWDQYHVQAWPTVMVIDPFGKIVGQLAGEPIYDQIAPVIETMAQEYGASGALNLDPLSQLQPELASLEETPLLFPGKVLADAANNRLFISDSNHNRIVMTTLDTYEILDVIGSGEEGLKDGDFGTSLFFRPQGLALDGNMLFVADTENHAIRAVNLDSRTVTTIAGTGEQGFNYDESGPGPEIALSSPWDLVVVGGKVYIAMAGPHQIWVYDIDSGIVGPYAGSGREALSDGKLPEAGMNQPSGIDSDGNVLYFADPEASAIRTADLNPDGEVKTIVGTGLFDFGDVDGVGEDVRLQHPLGVTVADDGYLYVADTYNDKIKRIDPNKRESTTYLGTGEAGLADGDNPMFYEPGGIDYANGKLYIADTNNNAIRVVDMASSTVSTVQFPNPELLSGAQISTPNNGGIDTFGKKLIMLPPQTVGVGDGSIILNVTMPEGYDFNGQAPFTAIWPENPIAQVPADSHDIRIVLPEMPLEVPVAFSEGQTDLTVDLTVYWCESVNETLCFVDRAQLTVPLTVTAESETQTVNMDYALVPPTVQENTFQ
jgi:thiol-disulfide isomerase/thioredoxin